MRLALLLAASACRPVLAPTVPTPASDPTAEWSAALSEVVTAEGLVDYDRLEERRDALDAYVAWVAKPRNRKDRDVPRHAFAINAYNALVLFAVLHDDRPSSVLDVEGWLPRAGSGFFYERAFLVEGYPTSLFELEHEWLRGRMMDSRDHAALNCASRSCPPLRASAYSQMGIEAELDQQMAAWVMDEARGVRIEGDEAVFNPIFDWYAWDFSFFNAGEDLCTVAARHATGPKRDALKALARQGCPHRFFVYDWSLNDASGG